MEKLINIFLKDVYMNKCGMTLIEIVMVIFIIFIILTISIPKGTVVLNFKERKDLKELKRDIIYCRNMSITDVKLYSIEIYPRDNYYCVSKYDKEKKIVKKKVLESNLKFVTVNFNGSDNSEYGQLLFNTTGSPRMAGNIRLKNRNGENIKLTIEVATGKVNTYIDGEK